MGVMASQITSLTSTYSTVYSGVDQRKHQRSASLAFMWEIHRGTGEFPAQMASNAENVSILWVIMTEYKYPFPLQSRYTREYWHRIYGA